MREWQSGVVDWTMESCPGVYKGVHGPTTGRMVCVGLIALKNSLAHTESGAWATGGVFPERHHVISPRDTGHRDAVPGDAAGGASRSGATQPALTRVAVLMAPGRPLEHQTVPLPEPAPGEVLVRVLACSLCASDLHTAHGRRPHVMPTVLGHEIVGEVAAVGPGEPPRDVLGAAVEPGQRITWSVCASCGTCDRCRRDLPQKCRQLFKYGHAAWDAPHCLAGGLADHALLVTGTAIVPLPEGLSSAAAAPASCAVATAAAILRGAGEVAGRSVVIFGAGMLGISVASLARAAGAALVTVVDPQPKRLLRAAAVVEGIVVSEVPTNSTSGAGGDGADIVVEAGGAAAAVTSAIATTAVGGICVLAGTVSPVGDVPFDPEQLVRRQATIRGVHNYRPADLLTAVRHLASPAGVGLATAVGPVFSLEQVNDALAAAATGDALRVVVMP